MSGFKGETICSIHDDIIKKANEIMKLKTKNFDNIDDFKWETDSLADDIKTLAEKAKEAGQRMEDAIKARREAIEHAVNVLEESL